MKINKALQALETIEKSWREDRVRSDMLPAIQYLRQILVMGVIIEAQENLNKVCEVEP